MTDIEAKQAAIEPAVDEATPPPPPEPWTPARVSEWNAYYDVYVAAFVLALAFLGSANKIQATNSGLWSQLQAGRRIVEAGSPFGLGAATLAGEGRRWVNIPWVFEVVHYGLFQAVAPLAPPPDPALPTPPGVRGDQLAAGSLVALDALIRALTAYLLLGLRRKGPGLWWTALCVTIALGVTLSPEPVESVTPGADGGQLVRVISPALGIQLGGIAGVASVAPETWGMLLLAAELLLLHQALNLGRAGRLYPLIPLFAVWANVDETFAFGLLMLAATTAGRFLDDRRASKGGSIPGPSGRMMAIVLAGSLLATLFNPSHIFGILGGFGVLLRAIGLQVGPPAPQPTSLFGFAFQGAAIAPFARSFQAYFAILTTIGLASFALNRRRFSMSRFLLFVAATTVWGFALLYSGGFALVFVAILALNGQEWYQDTFGVEGRLGAGWVVWSTGGRLLTIVLIFGAIFQATTGWGGQVGESRFGFGFDPDDFPFESAAAVLAAPVEGGVLNTTLAQGDALAWRANGKRTPYIDSKAHLYTPADIAKFNDLRRAIRDDKVDVWRPTLDAAGISSVMIEINDSPITYTKLMSSPNWVPFYDDGAVAIFGRSDDPAHAADVAFFKANSLDADALAFRRPKPVPAWLGLPRAVVEAIDRIFQNRLLTRPQPHVEAARRWLRPVTVPAGTEYLPDPAHCLLAIRELRTALSSKPDDFLAYRLLMETYRVLLAQESALLVGIKPAPENITRIMQAQPQPRLLPVRMRQLLTALNFAIQTMPPPRTAADRLERSNLNYNLAQLYLQNGALDLARERLLAMDGRPGELSDEFFKNQTRLLGDLNKRIDQVQAQLNELVGQQRPSPQFKANFVRNSGAPGMALRELEEANEAGGGQGGVKADLVDLYNDTGQPDKALDLISLLTNVDDPSLSTGIGTSTHRQGMIYYLLGNYANAISLWRDRSIQQIETSRLMQGPMATQVLLKGEAVASTRMFIELPEKVDQQAEWEFELAMAALESGASPELAADHFRIALELEPNLGVRPLIAYYLEQLGKPVPPPTSPDRPSATIPTTSNRAPSTASVAALPGPELPERRSLDAERD